MCHQRDEEVPAQPESGKIFQLVGELVLGVAVGFLLGWFAAGAVIVLIKDIC